MICYENCCCKSKISFFFNLISTMATYFQKNFCNAFLHKKTAQQMHIEFMQFGISFISGEQLHFIISFEMYPSQLYGKQSKNVTKKVHLHLVSKVLAKQWFFNSTTIAFIFRFPLFLTYQMQVARINNQLWIPIFQKNDIKHQLTFFNKNCRKLFNKPITGFCISLQIDQSWKV